MVWWMCPFTPVDIAPPISGTWDSGFQIVSGTGFQLPPAGSYIAIRGLKEGKWLRVQGCHVGYSWGGNDNLADWARDERFKLGTGSGTHALHSTEWNRFIIMEGGSLKTSKVLSEDEWPQLPAGGRFALLGTVHGTAIWSGHNKRFIINEFGSIGVGPVEEKSAAYTQGGVGSVVSKRDFRVLHQTYTRQCGNLYTSAGASCKILMIGKRIALYNPHHERWIRVKEGGWADASAGHPRNPDVTLAYTIPPSLATGWTWERFKVVDAGNGNVALHNTEHNRFLAMDGQGFIRAGGLRDEEELSCDASTGEHFTFVSYGASVALHNAHFNHFVKMDHQNLIVLGPLNSDQLTSANSWEMFLIAEDGGYQKDDCPYLYFPKGASCKPWLISQKVSFYNPWHHRFMKIINIDGADLVTTTQQGSDDLCDSCDDERFRAVDVGMGMLGLYNEKFGRYVQMTDAQKMVSTSIMAKSDLQGGWQWEKFHVVDLLHGKIGLHSAYHNRFVVMKHQTVEATSVQYDWYSLPQDYAWERFTITYGGYGDHWTPEPWEYFTDQWCKGYPYTHDECGGNCNGWGGLTQADCQAKCENDEKPIGCQQEQSCMGAVYYPSTGWCHLYSICPETESQAGAVAIRRKVSPFNFLEMHSTVTKQTHAIHEAEKDDLEKVHELAVSLPIVLINLTNYSGLISSGPKAKHLNIPYRFGNYSTDLEMLSDKTAGFYGALHRVMGEDAIKYCPHQDWTHIEQCIRIASCLIEPAVEAGKLPIAFLVAIMEQLARFDIIWDILITALIKESNTNQTVPNQILPPKYVCDMFDDLNAKTLTPSMIQEKDTAVRSTSTFAALDKATRETHRILSSLTSSENVSHEAVKKRWEETWYPVCVRMRCDHMNYWDIVLASYKQTLLFMKSGKLSDVKSEIINRATLQRRFQNHLDHPVLVQLWRRDAQASSLEAAQAYGLAGHKAVKGALKKFLEAPGGLEKVMKLVDRVEFEKWRSYTQTKEAETEETEETHGEVTPQHQRQKGQVNGQGGQMANHSLGLLSRRSEGVWDFLANMVKCFGKWSLWYAQGYYKALGTYGSVSFGMAAGNVGAFESLVKDLIVPQAFVNVWAAVGIGLSVSAPGSIPSAWVGLRAMLSTLEVALEPLKTKTFSGDVVAVLAPSHGHVPLYRRGASRILLAALRRCGHGGAAVEATGCLGEDEDE
eukprot:Skav235404  [mRNA]  locus=scaffold487:153515:161185:- [translate_table: standard]